MVAEFLDDFHRVTNTQNGQAKDRNVVKEEI